MTNDPMPGPEPPSLLAPSVAVLPLFVPIAGAVRIGPGKVLLARIAAVEAGPANRFVDVPALVGIGADPRVVAVAHVVDHVGVEFDPDEEG